MIKLKKNYMYHYSWKVQTNNYFPNDFKVLGLWCLMPLSPIFQLYHSSDFKCSREYFIFLQWSICHPPVRGILIITILYWNGHHYIYHCNDWKMKNSKNSTASMLHVFPISTIFSLVHLHSYPFNIIMTFDIIYNTNYYKNHTL
jgi:hypothetical protein